MITLLIVSLIILGFLCRQIVLPYIRYLSYRRYGKGMFYPLFGEFVKVTKCVKEYGNSDYHRWHLLDKDNTQRVFVANTGRNINGYFPYL